jgi:small subunit ribosomal protein S17
MTDITPVNESASERGLRKTRVGVVVSNKMDKTIVIVVERRIQHPVFKKYMKQTRKFMAHDANNECDIGDRVRIMETRPQSKRKNWRLVSILEKKK